MGKQTVLYVLVPLLSALIGWITNAIAVKMIFRPRRPLRLGVVTIQGLMPRRQADLARKIGETVESKLLTHEDIRESLSKPEVQAEIGSAITEQIEVFFRDKLAANPMVAMFLQGEMAAGIKRTLVAQIQGALPDLVDTMLTALQRELDLKGIVEAKIAAYDISALEAIVFDIAARELRLIVVLGGVLGFLVGLVQVAIFALTATGSSA
jgi:uncharacterized membrane protein YheB (UPF0754 family)